MEVGVDDEVIGGGDSGGGTADKKVIWNVCTENYFHIFLLQVFFS